MLVSADTSNPNFNYYNNGVFIFNNYKTNKVYKSQIEAVPEELNKIIKVYLKFKPKNDNFLCYYDGTALNHSNQITRILNRIFGNKISVSMLRNIFISDKFSPVIKDMENTAQAMGTSVNMLQNTYAKQD
jgi:hypothetical protein